MISRQSFRQKQSTNDGYCKPCWILFVSSQVIDSREIVPAGIGRLDKMDDLPQTKTSSTYPHCCLAPNIHDGRCRHCLEVWPLQVWDCVRNRRAAPARHSQEFQLEIKSYNLKPFNYSAMAPAYSIIKASGNVGSACSFQKKIPKPSLHGSELYN